MTIKVNDYPVVISAHYVTGNPDEGFMGSIFIRDYASLKEVNEDLERLLAGLPSKHYRLEFDWQDAPIPKCSCARGKCDQWMLASDEVGYDCKGVYP